MYKLTEEEISQEIIDQYIPLHLKSREKIIKKINEQFQYHPETYIKANKGDYSFIKNLLEYHIFLVY